MKIAILGMGNVGSGVFNILKENGFDIRNNLKDHIDVKKVLVKNLDRDRACDKSLLTNSFEEILLDDEIGIVVELIGGIDPAYDYIKRSLEKGKHVVTANKAVIATHGQALAELAEKNGCFLRYEASVAGGIPIINTMIDSLSANKIEEIIGIINGTTNFILTQMTQKGLTFAEALKLAQDKGYAEADPTSDIEGQDAAYKTVILSSVAFGVNIKPEDILTEGIVKITKSDIEYAKELGYTIKLLATTKNKEDSVEAYVLPSLVPQDHPLASINNEFNALFVKGNAVGEILLCGKGAGSYPTGSAVMADIIAITKSVKDGLKNDSTAASRATTKPVSVGDGQYYIRLLVEDKPGVLGAIALAFGKHGVSIESMVQHGIDDCQVPLVFITHSADKESFDKALDEIKSIDTVFEIGSVLKVL